MNFMKIILVLAATLAIVAVSFASAGSDACVKYTNNKSCVACCIGQGFKTGALMRETQTTGSVISIEDKCYCSASSPLENGAKIE